MSENTLLGGEAAPVVNEAVNTKSEVAPVVNEVASSSAEFKFPDNWTSFLPEDLKGEASLKTMTDIPTLAKSYINAQKLIGADKIPVPSKHATDEDWGKVYNKLGLPEKFEDYKIDLPDPKTTGLEPEFLEKFKENAFKAGMLPKQANKLMAWYQEMAKESVAKFTESKTQAEADGITGLKKEWGDAFEQNVRAARIALKEFADPETVKFLEESRLGNNPALVKLLYKAGMTLREDVIKGDPERYSANVMTPAEATKRANAVMGDPTHPYFDSKHPNHKSAVSEVQGWFKMAHPSEDK